MKDSVHTLIYAAVLGLVCSLCLTGAARFTEQYRKDNAKAEEMSNILKVLGVPFDPDAPSEELVGIFEDNVRREDREGLTTYVYRPAGRSREALAVAVQFAGPGLWGPIKGLLALEPDMKTIRGIAFYQQEETPGLGGEIDSQWFKDQFKGKLIYGAAGRPGIRIRTGGAVGPNEVDAITGATMTCRKVEAMINEAVELFAEERNESGR